MSMLEIKRRLYLTSLMKLIFGTHNCHSIDDSFGFCTMIIFCLLLSDAVEFETIADRRTGKPIATKIISLVPGSVSPEITQDEQFIGFVVTEARMPYRRVSISKKLKFIGKYVKGLTKRLYIFRPHYN